jgi:hypothetical protein
MISTDCTCVVATVMSKCDGLLYKAAVRAGLSMEQSLPVAMINRTHKCHTVSTCSLPSSQKPDNKQSILSGTQNVKTSEAPLRLHSPARVYEPDWGSGRAKPLTLLR